MATSVERPTELYIANADGRSEQKLTGFNDALNAEIARSSAERFTYESVGGLEIEAWLQYPHGYDPSRRYPVVLYIHGGPHSAYGEGWFDEFHNITGAGMFVLFTNPRGSSNYGAPFTYSTRGQWGMEDYEDIMKAVEIVAERPDVDPERFGVTGGSYGGFMTAWITTKTDRFVAAQDRRALAAGGPAGASAAVVRPLAGGRRGAGHGWGCRPGGQLASSTPGSGREVPDSGPIAPFGRPVPGMSFSMQAPPPAWSGGGGMEPRRWEAR